MEVPNAKINRKKPTLTILDRCCMWQ